MLNMYTMKNFISCDATYEDAKVIIFGAPFDGTTSFRPGTRFAPQAIRTDSYGLETYSPYLDLDLEDYLIGDIGDIDLPFGNTTEALARIGETSAAIISEHKKPLMIGGEHLVSLPTIEALSKVYPDLHIIHFDAHTDLRDDYLGEKLSHATVMRRAWEIVGDDHIFQFGIRSGTRDEFNWAKTHTFLHPFDLNSLHDVLPKLIDKPIYLSIDLDVLDPSLFSGTGTPEPGGITMKELLHALVLIHGLNLVGADVVELSPHYDASGVSTATACKVIREVALLLAAKSL